MNVNINNLCLIEYGDNRGEVIMEIDIGREIGVVLNENLIKTSEINGISLIINIATEKGNVAVITELDKKECLNCGYDEKCTEKALKKLH